eukprot:NODE_5210_length_593_cov_94.400735_g4507_i0.p1 GENE.NODE_5210_length_593_cov_94.400735_g4507_i0~~NODE_5210_length_593_cov_94.400735_g4507_i0.p1  ORF type:complete len:192 (+),score=67.19 NODE_5210_length_593_cov_94.400735_g4507_i0:31-576(+)
MMKGLFVTALLLVSTLAYQGHNSDKKDDSLVVWFNENNREFMRGLVFGLEGGRYKKPSQSQCVADVDSFFYGVEDAWEDVVNLLSGNFDDTTSIIKAVMAIMNIFSVLTGGCELLSYFKDIILQLLNFDFWWDNLTHIMSDTASIWHFFTFITESAAKGKWFYVGSGIGEMIYSVLGVKMH